MKIDKPISFAQWKNPIIFYNNSVNGLWGLNTTYNIDMAAELVDALSVEINREIIKQMLEFVPYPGLPVADDRLLPGIPSENLYDAL